MVKLNMKSVMAVIALTSFVPATGIDPEAATEKVAVAPALSQNQVTDDKQKFFRECPPPYAHVLGECFYVHMYIPLMTWADARTFCKQAGGVLAEPTYFGALIAQLYNDGMADKIFRGIFNGLWLGGRRAMGTNATASASFEWASSGRPIDDPVTEDGVDPYFLGESGDCVMMIMHKDGPFRLAPKSCDVKTHYVCQLP